MLIPRWSGEESNCSNWRCLIPCNQANEVGEANPSSGWKGKLLHVSGFMDYLNPTVQDWVAPADIIVFQRNVVSQEAFAAIQYWQGMGKPVVIDLDDAYQMLPWSNPAHRFWMEKDDGQAVQMLEHALRLSNGLVAPNRNLLSDWAHACHGYYLPNFAEDDWWLDLPSRDDLKKQRGLEDRTIIGWGGSVSHYDSWWGSGIREAATRICQRHPEVVWMICGNDGRIFQQLPVPVDQKIKQVGVPPDKWPQIVAHFDVGVAPLFGIYDQRRSWIKGLEYLLGSVPFVATGGEPYRDLEEKGLGYYVPNGADAWEEAIEKILANLGQEQEQAAELVEVGRQWLIGNSLGTVRKVYGEIIEDFQSERGILPGVYWIRAERKAEKV